MLRELAGEQVPWNQVHVVQVDERVAPADSDERNFKHLRESLLSHAPLPPANLHAMPVEADDLPAAAAQYARTLESLAGSPPALDLVHLGLGPGRPYGIAGAGRRGARGDRRLGRADRRALSGMPSHDPDLSRARPCALRAVAGRGRREGRRAAAGCSARTRRFPPAGCGRTTPSWSPTVRPPQASRDADMARTSKAEPRKKVRAPKKVLAIDIGGSHVKILATGQRTKREVDLGPDHDRAADGRRRQEAGRRLGLRRDLDRLSGAGGAQQAGAGAGEPRQGLVRLRLRGGLRPSGQGGERRHDAGDRRL